MLITRFTRVCIRELFFSKFSEDHRMLVEPSCGVSLAAIYSDVIPKLQQKPKGHNPIASKELKNVVIIVCGGNAISPEILVDLQKKVGLIE